MIGFGTTMELKDFDINLFNILYKFGLITKYSF